MTLLATTTSALRQRQLQPSQRQQQQQHDEQDADVDPARIQPSHPKQSPSNRGSKSSRRKQRRQQHQQQMSSWSSGDEAENNADRRYKKSQSRQKKQRNTQDLKPANSSTSNTMPAYSLQEQQDIRSSTMDGAPQVLLWPGSSMLSSSSHSQNSITDSSTGSRDDDSRDGNRREEDGQPIFRGQPAIVKQYNERFSVAPTFSEDCYDDPYALYDQDHYDYEYDGTDNEHERDGLKGDAFDILGSSNQWQWLNIEYWKQRWSVNCCLPMRESSYHDSSSNAKNTHTIPYHDPRLSYPPGNTTSNHAYAQAFYYHHKQQQQKHQYHTPVDPRYQHYHYQQYQQCQQQQQHQQQLMRYPNVAGPSQVQISPLTVQSFSPVATNANDVITASTTTSNMSPHTLYPQQSQPQANSNQMVALPSPPPPGGRGHCRTVSESPQLFQHKSSTEENISDDDDILSISSLESFSNPGRNTPLLHSHKQQEQMAISPDDDTDNDIATNGDTMVDDDGSDTEDPLGARLATTTANSRQRTMPSQRQRSSLTASGNKPPVAPSRRSSQQTQGGKQLPPLPSPPSFGAGSIQNANTTPTQQPVHRSPRQRCFSETSENTTGSRHFRGGTVSFDFDVNTTNDNSSLDSSFAAPPLEAAGSTLSKAPFDKDRSASLPVEVQIRVHPVWPMHHQRQLQSELLRRRSSAQSFDTGDPNISMSSSWDCTPPRKWQLPTEESTPEGYISPLEEELLHTTNNTVASHGRRTSSSAATATSSVTASCASSISPYAQRRDSSNRNDTRNSSNPQDDSIEDDEDDNDTPTGIMPRISFEDTSPFAKLKEPPAIPKGEAWMWQWLNQASSGSSDAMSPTRGSRSIATDGASVSSRGSVKYLDPSNKPAVIQEVYFPRNNRIEEAWKVNLATSGSPSKETIALSGWVAFGLGDSLQQKLTSASPALLDSKDIGYVVTTTASNKVWVSNGTTNGIEHELDLKDCRVQVEEISCQHGRAVVVKRNSTGETVFTLLPVCLPEGYAGSEVAELDGSLCFPAGDYLPDDQQYTAMHIMFALGTLIKAHQTLDFL